MQGEAHKPCMLPLFFLAQSLKVPANKNNPLPFIL